MLMKLMNQSGDFWQKPFATYFAEGGAGGQGGMTGTGGAKGGVESLEAIPGVNMEEYAKLSPNEQRKVIVEKMKEAQSLGDKAAAKAQKEYEAKLSEISAKEAELKPALQLKEALENDPELKKVVQDYASGKLTKKETNENFEDLLDEATPEERKMLKRIKKFVLADVPTSPSKEVESLKEELKILKTRLVDIDYERSDTIIDKLRNDFGKDTIDKYEDKMRDLLIKYPSAKPDQLFLGLSGISNNRDDLFAAVKFNKEKSNKVSEDLKRRGLDPSGEAVKTKVELVRIKDSKGRDDIKATFKNFLVERFKALKR